MKSKYRVTSLAALVIACGGVTSENTQERAKASHTDSEADSLACVEGTTTSGWVAGGIGSNSGTFTLELDATPGTGDEDALVGLAPNAPATYSDLAAIVRFNTDGKLDARDGGAYRAVADIPYQAGERHHLTFSVDTTAHTYSAWDANGTIASGFAFRSEQANAGELAFYGTKVDAGGPLDVCNVIVPNQYQSCMSANAGQGFVNVAFAPQETFVSIAFAATPSDSNVDTVVGVSTSAAQSFNDMAAAVRFNPDGIIDARDGDVYRPLTQNHYAAGTTYRFVLLLDVQMHTYAVRLNGTLALENLAFRTQQANAPSLGNLVLESDAETGSVTRCETSVSPAHDAAYMHEIGAWNGQLPVPLPDGRYLAVGESQTVVVDTSGFPAGTAAVTGLLAVDAAGNLYKTGTFVGTFDAGAGPLTSAGGVDAYVVKYDAAFNPVWSARFGGPDDDTVSAPRANARGDVLFVLDDNLARLDAQGNLVYAAVPFSPGARLALAPDGSVFVSDDPPASNALSITKLDPSGNTAWTHVMPTSGYVTLEALVADATGGAVFSGEIDGAVDLGGHTYELRPNEDGSQVYVAKLDGNAQYVYAHTTDFAYFGGLTADGRGNAAASGTHGNGFYPVIDEYRSDGSLLREITGGTLVPAVTVGSAGMPVIADWPGNLYFTLTVGIDNTDGYFLKLRAD
jgi:hypothetical protein